MFGKATIRLGIGPHSSFWKLLMRCKTEGKLVLITNRKSHMSLRFVPKSVALNDLAGRNGRYFALFQRIL